MNLTKFLFTTLDKISPKLAAKQVYNHMSSPRVRKSKEFEENALRTAETWKVKFKDYSIQGYRWGKPTKPVALMVHGWEGKTGNFGALLEPILKKGYQVIGFDGPAHGKSSRGNTSMFEYADFITSVFKEHQPTVLISHSFGTVSSLFSMIHAPIQSIKQWFIITTPFNFEDRIKDVRSQMGASEQTMNILIQRIEKETGHQLHEMNMAYMAPRMTHIKESFIIHSRTDRVLSIEDARKTAEYLPNSLLFELDNLGHYGILWSDDLIQIIKMNLSSAHPS